MKTKITWKNRKFGNFQNISHWSALADPGNSKIFNFSVIDTVENAGAAVKNGASDLDEKLMGSG